MKVTDEQILLIDNKAKRGEANIREQVRGLDITEKTFYVRRKSLLNKEKECIRTLDNAMSTLPTTLESINEELQELKGEIREKRKQLKGNNIKEYCMLYDRHLASLNSLSANLKTFKTYVDARQVNITIEQKDTVIEGFIKDILIPWLMDTNSRGQARDALSRLYSMYESEKERWKDV